MYLLQLTRPNVIRRQFDETTFRMTPVHIVGCDDTNCVDVLCRYHNDRMVNYDSERGISVTTTPGRRTHSQLSIKKAVVSDSGNYTCAPARSLPASIHVFVAGNSFSYSHLPNCRHVYEAEIFIELIKNY